MIKSIHHVSLLVSSEETLTFYKSLGFTESYRKTRANDVIVLMDGYGMQLEVFADDRHPKRFLDLTEPLGCRHFALKVDDISSTLSSLQERGIERHTDIGTDWVGERYCYITDPDGNQVELHE